MRLHTQTSPDARVASASLNGLLPRAIRWRACLGLLLAGASLSASAATNTVECDFSTRLKVGPMNGILEGWDGENPSDELISGIT